MNRALLIILLLLLASRVVAQDVVHYHDATQNKALVDDYLSAFEANDETQTYWLQRQIIARLFEAYDRQAYTETLHYLHSLENTYPDAVLALSDSLQAYWDSNYLQSYLVGSAAEYGKLKFLATLGIVGGGLGLLKNPLASSATLQGFNFLLPLAGGVGAYYAVEFFRQPLPDVPLEPQQVLSFASGERYFSYAQKRNDYLYRLFSVGIGLGSGEFIFKALGGGYQLNSGASDPASKGANKSTKTISGLTYIDEDAKKAHEEALQKQAKRKGQSLFKPQASLSYFARAAGAILGIYLIHKGTHYVARQVELRKAEHELWEAQEEFGAAHRNGDQQALINAAKKLVKTTLQLVTLYEMPQLHAMVEFEQKFSQQAGQLSNATDEELRDSLQEMTLKLSKSLQAKLRRAMAHKNYHYDRVPLLQALAQSSYTQLKQSTKDTRVAKLLQEFEHEHVEAIVLDAIEEDDAGRESGKEPERSTAELDKKFRAWVELSLSDRYAVAQETLEQGELQRNIELLFQVAALFKASATDSNFVFLQHFHQQLLAKFQNMLLMYRNFEAIIDHNAVWKIKFSAAELDAVLDLYLDYYRADSQATVPVPQQRQGRKVLTSTRGFARFLAEYIAALPTKPYNQLLLRMLNIYHEQPVHRAALVVLLEDIEAKAELHDNHYDSIWLSTLEGSFIGAAALMVTRMAAKLMHVLGADVSKPYFHWIAKLLGTGGSLYDPDKGMRLASRRHWTQLGKVALVGAAAGYVYYFAKKLQTHKLPPKAALFDVQKAITLDLAFNSCVLAHEVSARIKGKDELQAYSAEQIQQEREALSAFALRLQALSAQARHLNESAPSLSGKHLVTLPQHLYLDNVVPQCQPVIIATRQTAVSIAPLAQDLDRTAKQLRGWKQTLDIIEYRRLSPGS